MKKIKHLKLKNLYKISILQRGKAPGILYEASRTVEVAANDASQAIRKLKYNLTQKGEPLKEFEFIDEVARLGTIEVK